MSKQKSLFETWSALPSPQSARRAVQGYLPLILSVAGALAVAPFAVIRWMAGEWLLGIIDTVIVVGFAILAIFVYRTRKVRAANIALSIVFVSGALATIYARGPQQILWIFPALMAAFYVLKPREALVVAFLVLAALLPQLANSVDPFRAGTTIITILLTCAIAFSFAEINNRQQKQLLALATRDSLTGAGNRRALRGSLAKIIASFERLPSPACLILLDIDYFKRVNDTHGHATGDLILRRIAQLVDMRIRITDGLYRIGGEEFVVVVDGQGADIACQLAEELRVLIERHEMLPGVSVTVSLGVAELRSVDTRQDWLRRADEALYEAKRAGRNTMKLAS